ncbi:ArsR/SmtB family transcription factor [Kitasatospora sp. NPDC057936]|uniref:ArsR/SmtB family transcription factor n=1 Tax=Kitasatospora sp. NPDC057936 TaxID=3346283 RepID=UPI0036D8FA6F
MARTTFAVSSMDQIIGGIAGAEHHCVGASLGRARWWRRMRQHVPHQADRLLELVNASFEGVPDFLVANVESGRQGLADELDAIVALPESRIRRDLDFYGDDPGLPPIVRELRDGGTRGLRLIADGAWALFRSCFAADWPDIRRLLGADIAHRSRAAAEAGTGVMLERLHPQTRWRTGEVLQLTVHGLNEGWDLDGRGVELRPNIFLTSITALPTEHPAATVLYPSRARPAGGTVARRTDGLAGLMGATRARALRAIGLGPCTTAELSRRLGLSPASASAHATVLRVAGVITTEREGRQVRHDLTPLGHDLLLNNPEPPGTGGNRG